MAMKFTNNASAALAASISSSSTSITVTTGQGALFPTLGAGDYFYATLFDSSNHIEIIKVTARSGDTLTATRGQDSTTARAFAAADKLELRVTAAALNDLAVESNDNTFSGTNSFSGTSTFTGATTLSGNVTSSGTNTFSGSNTFSGAVALTGTPTATTPTFGTNSTALATTAFVQAALAAIYPVNSIYSSTSSTDPGTIFGFGVWVAFAQGRMMMGAGGSYAAGSTGGSADAIVPYHTHTATSTDSGHTHPYQLRDTPGSYPQGSHQGDGAPWSIASTNTGYANISTSITAAGTAGNTVNANLPPYVVVYMWRRSS